MGIKTSHHSALFEYGDVLNSVRAKLNSSFFFSGLAEAHFWLFNDFTSTLAHPFVQIE